MHRFDRYERFLGRVSIGTDDKVPYSRTQHHAFGWENSNRQPLSHKVSKGAKIRNRYNQVPHLTQDTNGKVTDSQ